MVWCCARKMQRIACVKFFTTKTSHLKWSSTVIPGFSPSFVLCSNGSWWKVMMCPSIYQLSVLWGEILRGRNDVVWTGESVVFLFCFVVVGTVHLTLSQLSAYTDPALLKQRALWPLQVPAREQTSKHKCICYIYFTLARPAAVKMFGEQLGQFLLAPCGGTC